MNTNINIVDEINNIMKNVKREYSKIVDNNKNNNNFIKLREVNATLNDVLEYIFRYSQINATKINVTSDIKNETIDENKLLNKNKKYIESYSSYDQKIKNIPVVFFKNLCSTFSNLLIKYTNDNNTIKDISTILNKSIYVNHEDIELSVSAADGSCNNLITNGKLHTDQNVFIHNVCYNNPTDIVTYMEKKNMNINIFDNNKNNTSDKNHELKIYMNHIKNNLNDKYKNSIQTADRAYACYELLDFFIKNNIKFVIRLKENMHILDDEPDNHNKKDKNYNIKKILRENPNIKIIESGHECIKTVTSKTNKTTSFKLKSKMYLITNLGNAENFSDELIINIYKLRWSIEILFKKLKNNFKFQTFYLKDNEYISKIKYIDCIIYIITQLLILKILKNKYEINKNIFNKKINKRPFNKQYDMRFKINKIKKEIYEKNKNKEADISVNYTEFVRNFYKYLARKIVHGRLDESDLNDDFIKITKNEKDRVCIRKSIIPFTKWYVKMYHKKYEYEKIFEAIENDTINDLNKNLKCKALQIKDAIIKGQQRQ